MRVPSLPVLNNNEVVGSRVIQISYIRFLGILIDIEDNNIPILLRKICIRLQLCSVRLRHENV